MNIDLKGSKVIWFFFRAHKLQCFWVLVLMFFSGLLEAVNLAALYPIVNYGLNLQEKKSLIWQNFEKIVQFISPGNPFLASCILLGLITVLALAFKFVYTYFSSRLLITISGDIQKKIFERFVAADYNFYVKNQQGKLIYAGTVAPDKAFVIILYSILLIYHAINVLFLFSLLVFLNWQTTSLIVVFGVLYSLVIQKILQKLIHQWAKVSVVENQQKNIILNEFVTGIKTIKIFLAAHQWEKRYNESVDRSLIYRFRMYMGAALPESFVKFMFFISLAVAGVFLSQRSHGEILALLPMFGIFLLVANRILPFANSLASDVMEITKNMPDAQIVYEICTESFSDEGEGATTLNGFNDRITFSNVSFKYEAMKDDLLKHLSFSIEKKKITAIVGLSGSGKTTIINLLLKLYKANEGTIQMDGVDISDFSNKSYLSRIGYVSQETFIFNSSFKDNIRFGMPGCSDAMIEEAAQLANAHEFIKEAPNGYDTMVGDSGVKISGGQRQRVAIARAMLRKPEIIVLDEATSSLDNISERKIQAAINNISKNTTVLVIAHRLSTVQNADKIIILEKGEIKEQGTHEELLNNRSLYYDLYMSKDEVKEDVSIGEK